MVSQRGPRFCKNGKTTAWQKCSIFISITQFTKTAEAANSTTAEAANSTTAEAANSTTAEAVGSPEGGCSRPAHRRPGGARASSCKYKKIIQVPKLMVKSLIGIKGAFAKSVKSATGLLRYNVRVDSRGCGLVTLIGTTRDAVRRAATMVMGKVGRLRSAHEGESKSQSPRQRIGPLIHRKIQVPEYMVALLIGRNGAFAEKVKSETGICSYGAKSLPDSGVITIVGPNEAAVEAAATMVESKVGEILLFQVHKDISSVVGSDDPRHAELEQLVQEKMEDIPDANLHQVAVGLRSVQGAAGMTIPELILDEIDFVMAKRSHWHVESISPQVATPAPAPWPWALHDGKQGRRSQSLDDYTVQRTSAFRYTIGYCCSPLGVCNEIWTAQKLVEEGFACPVCGGGDVRLGGGSTLAWTDLVCHDCLERGDHTFFELKTFSSYQVEKAKRGQMRGGSFKYFLSQRAAGARHFAIVCPKQGGKAKMYKIKSVQPCLNDKFLACFNAGHSVGAGLKTLVRLEYDSDLFETDDLTAREFQCKSVAESLLKLRFSAYARKIQLAFRRHLRASSTVQAAVLERDVSVDACDDEWEGYEEDFVLQLFDEMWIEFEDRLLETCASIRKNKLKKMNRVKRSSRSNCMKGRYRPLGRGKKVGGRRH